MVGSFEGQSQARPRAKRMLRSRAAVSALFVAGIVAASAGPAMASPGSNEPKAAPAHVEKADKADKGDGRIKLDEDKAKVMKADKGHEKADKAEKDADKADKKADKDADKADKKADKEAEKCAKEAAKEASKDAKDAAKGKDKKEKKAKKGCESDS